MMGLNKADNRAIPTIITYAFKNSPSTSFVLFEPIPRTTVQWLPFVWGEYEYSTRRVGISVPFILAEDNDDGDTDDDAVAGSDTLKG